MKKISMATIIVISVIMSAAIVGCAPAQQKEQSSSTSETKVESSSTTKSESSSSTESTSSSTPEEVAEFDGSSFSETGPGTMIISTPNGTSENGNIPEIPAKKEGSSSVSLRLYDGDGSLCTIYVDGIYDVEYNFTKQASLLFALKTEQLSEGIHTIELVKMNGDKPAIYKKAQYKCV